MLNGVTLSISVSTIQRRVLADRTDVVDKYLDGLAIGGADLAAADLDTLGNPADPSFFLPTSSDS